MTYEKLLIEADTEDLIVKEKTLINYNGLIKGKLIAYEKIYQLFKNLVFLPKNWDIIILPMVIS